MRLFILSILYLLFSSSSLVAKQRYTLSNSIKTNEQYTLKKDTLLPQKKFNDPFWKHTIAPAIFGGLSAISWNANNNVRSIRNRYTPDFRNKLDNYTQYAPGVTAFALNLSGVKGRNKFSRALIHWGGGMLIMGGLVNSIKYTARVMRPDGTTRNSFPSGHTATAFMNASFLHKEYGHVNSLYSVLGYTMSTYTGVSRSLNNRHWLSDILAGAGIGILSTELSYLIINSFYKNKGDFFTPFDLREELENPSFLSIRIGQAFYIDAHSFEGLGLEGAIEGAYYFNKRWGIGGEIGFLHMPFEQSAIGDLDWEDLPAEYTNPQMDIQSFGYATFMVGGYYAKILSPKFILQGKLLAGLGKGVGGNIDMEVTIDYGGKLSQRKIPMMEYKVNNSLVVGGGGSITAMLAPTLGLSLYLDYKYAQPKTRLIISDYYTDIKDKFVSNERLSISALSGGLKFTSFF